MAAGSARPESSETLWTDRARVRWSVPARGTANGTEPVTSHESDVLLAVSSRGVTLFMATHDPYDGEEAREFFTRLIRERGRQVTIVPGWWPDRGAALLDAWTSACT
ncbi:hypothetical protein J7E93_22520 [Streptomyces sp. ISL-36]|uniref:hypothetical protein n=1 Tax=Streptomyces sp. ISL-36 TaxID=2819182 RepID=UPI001BEA01A5|nr:hypothetical protein [Streptomyces sp. ISL-36]MBT2442828.1 hypothetical protein [Streptomyces sp. ISL-36]